MNVETFAVGIMPTNCYVLTDDSGLGLIVDPAAPSQKLSERIDDFAEGQIKYILLTHGHFDHIGYADELRKKTGAKIVIYKGEEKFLHNSGLNLSSFMGDLKIEPFNADIIVSDGEEIPFGENKIKVLYTPGHTSGSCCYMIDDILFTGDTLMTGSMGRTDFPTGNYNDILQSLKRLKNLDGNYRVYCGHGPATMLEHERKTNPCM